MEKKYTAGPWYAVDYAGTYVIQSEDFYSLNADLLDVEYCKDAEANATLMTTAPELLECLIEWLEMNGIDPFTTNTQGYSKLTVKAINTIKKAMQP